MISGDGRVTHPIQSGMNWCVKIPMSPGQKSEQHFPQWQWVLKLLAGRSSNTSACGGWITPHSCAQHQPLPSGCSLTSWGDKCHRSPATVHVRDLGAY